MISCLEDVARRLIGFDTVSSGSNLAAVEFLADRLDGCGFRVAVQRYRREGVPKGNLVAWAGPPNGGGLILSGHVDTVPFEGQPGWTRDPLRLEIAEDRVYGRGTADMKIFLAQCVEAARRLDAARLARPVVCLFTADEEVGCLGAARLIEELPALLGEVPVPALAWIGEPTSYRVFHAHKSIGVFEIRVRGRGGHSGLPALGVNAITVMGRVVEMLRTLQEEWRARPFERYREVFPDAPCTTLNLGTIRGGTATNVIAEECRLTVSYRSVPGIDPTAIRDEVAQRLLDVDRRDAGGSAESAAIEVGEASVVPAMLSTRGSALERELFAVLGESESRGALFAADGCRLAGAGILSLICGPGDLEQAHQPNESLARSAYERGTDLVLSVVQRLCGQS